MGRPLRIQFEDALYHVFPRGNRRQPIVHSNRDYQVLENYLIEAAIQSKVILRCWHPMLNHVHAMVETPHANIAAYMQRWMSRYARYYNWRYGTVGHLFQGRYGSRLVQTDCYQRELIRYILLNAHRAKQKLTALNAFQYSSHRFYMGAPCSPEIWSWIEPMLMLFGNTLESARLNYTKFLADGLANGNWKDFYTPQTSDILGDEDFVEYIHSLQERKSVRIVTPQDAPHQTISDLLTTAERIFNVRREDLMSSDQKRTWGRIRQAIAYVGRHALNLRTMDLARELGRDHSAISQMVRRVEEAASTETDQLLAAVQVSQSNV